MLEKAGFLRIAGAKSKSLKIRENKASVLSFWGWAIGRPVVPKQEEGDHPGEI